MRENILINVLQNRNNQLAPVMGHNVLLIHLMSNLFGECRFNSPIVTTGISMNKGNV